jgi:hypothetical protein
MAAHDPSIIRTARPAHIDNDPSLSSSTLLRRQNAAAASDGANDRYTAVAVNGEGTVVAIPAAVIAPALPVVVAAAPRPAPSFVCPFYDRGLRSHRGAKAAGTPHVFASEAELSVHCRAAHRFQFMPAEARGAEWARAVACEACGKVVAGLASHRKNGCKAAMGGGAAVAARFVSGALGGGGGGKRRRDDSDDDSDGERKGEEATVADEAGDGSDGEAIPRRPTRRARHGPAPAPAPRPIPAPEPRAFALPAHCPRTFAAIPNGSAHAWIAVLRPWLQLYVGTGSMEERSELLFAIHDLPRSTLTQIRGYRKHSRAVEALNAQLRGFSAKFRASMALVADGEVKGEDEKKEENEGKEEKKEEKEEKEEKKEEKGDEEAVANDAAEVAARRRRAMIRLVRCGYLSRATAVAERAPMIPLSDARIANCAL